MLEIAGLVIVACAFWLWHDSLKAREAGMRATRSACAAEGLLFLDDTVSIHSIWPARDDRGQLRLRRVYDFEYSDTGNNRQRGKITLIADSIVTIYLAPRPIARTAPD
jgi:hypothetical protein